MTRVVPLGRRMAMLVLALMVGLVTAAEAHAQATPSEPANGAQVVSGRDVVLRWALAPGWRTSGLEWSSRPETAFAGGRFLDPAGSSYSLGYNDVAWLMSSPPPGRYYWHVSAYPPADGEDPFSSVYGPAAYFDVVEPPPPPLPRGCSTQAAKAMADAALKPYLRELDSDFYTDESLENWRVAGPICRDMTGDGDREMIIRLPGGTGGATSPWAIFKHDQSGQWQMAYARGMETVWRLRFVKRRLRALMPAPYGGACTRFTREREVWYSGSRFRSKMLKRKRVRLPRSC